MIPICCAFLMGCGEDPMPKPKGYLRLDYPRASYKKSKANLPFTFQRNTLAQRIKAIKKINRSYGAELNYPSLKATLYLTYMPINNNLDSLLRDAQNLTQKHTVKADAILSKEFINENTNAYGMFYEVEGDAASQAQFYLTDSTSHFLTGALYFYAQPNYDSLYPASEYLKKDIVHFMETLNWND